MSATAFIGVARVWGDFSLSLRPPRYLSGSAELRDGTLRRVVLEGGVNKTIRIKNTFPKTTLTVRNGCAEYTVTAEPGEVIEIAHEGKTEIF
ncbi:MAG: hypothetical protein IJD51_04245 [Clostridia bacterium]|nr:hypothetical protein [Clostridia bacterium]